LELKFLFPVKGVLAAEAAKLLPLNFVISALTLTGSVVPVAAVGAFEEDVEFLIFHDTKVLNVAANPNWKATTLF